jgi:hypothetical protein
MTTNRLIAFQSYYSSIKTYPIDEVEEGVLIFQSYYSSIKNPPSESSFHAQLLGFNQRNWSTSD